MMDISDGLSSELIHICKDSDTGCRVYEDRIPIDYQTAVMAEELNMCKPELGCALVTRDGAEIQLRAQGWNPLAAQNPSSDSQEA